MPLLTDHQWQTKYDSDSSSLVREFYEPALSCGIRYDRSTGFFSAKLLTLAARGIESLVHNDGKMRLVIGCTIGEEEVKAIERGEKLREVVGNRLRDFPLKTTSTYEINALELLAWMIAKDYLDVKLAIPCSIKERKPVASYCIFHEKAGIIEDKSGNRLAFNGSVNETAQGWTENWESFHVFTDWKNIKDHVDAEERSFAKLWNNQADRCLVVDVQTAVKAEFLKFLPPDDQRPERLRKLDPIGSEKVEKSEAEPKSSPSSVVLTNTPEPLEDQFKKVWAIIQHGPAIVGRGDRVGEATSIIKPFPHQVKTFQRLYNNYPPKLLIADEVGLGKTIEAGLLLRQAWLSNRAKRILVLAPKAVLTQWQIELREKFNLNIPIYNGKTLAWYNSPGRNILDQPTEKTVSRQEWHKEPIVIVSSHLMRRKDRAKELLQEADPYDLIFLDEAHHARRQGDKGPNQLLCLMQDLKKKTQGLVLLTATPMQVDPIEVWDLMNLLGLPPAWNTEDFKRFFDYASSVNPSHPELEFMARLFRSVEEYFGETSLESVMRYVPNQSNLTAKKILKALRDEAQLPRKQLTTEQRKVAIKIMQANTPVARLVSRHTRELLRRYYEAGKISSRVASRVVKDEFVVLSPLERELYEAIENYISSTYNNASQADRNAVGFVMTIYRRRLASSFAALENTLKKRVEAIKQKSFQMSILDIDEVALREDISDDETENELMEAEDANQLEQETLKREEVIDLEFLLQRVKQLPIDTKAKNLLKILEEIKGQEYKQVIIFTQYTDTMEFLRKFLLQSAQQKIICFSGRGGELPNGDGSWRNISREETKRIFREGKADILICTDAAAEGLNFQFCGALINYDMPWNPMRVEQRIGRIDRLGQKYESIQIVNLHYQDTVETDVYIALKERIGLFSQFVGKLQPILATLSKNIASIILARGDSREQQKESILSDIEESRRQAEANSFDIDAITEADLDEPPREEALYSLDTLDLLLHHPTLLPPGLKVETMTAGEYKFSMPGMINSLRITTKPDYFDQHPESVELWSPGSPLFPIIQEELEETISEDLKSLLSSG